MNHYRPARETNPESEVQSWLTMRAKAREAARSLRRPLNDEQLAGLVPIGRH